LSLLFRPSWAPARLISGFLLCLLCAAMLAVGPNRAMATERPVIEITNLQAGFAGAFKVGRWTPVQFTLSASGPIEVVPVIRTADPDGRATYQPLAPVQLDKTLRSVQGVFRSGRLDGSIQILIFPLEWTDSSTPLRQQTLRVGDQTALRALRQSTQFWLAAGKHRFFSKGFERWNLGKQEVLRISELPEEQFAPWSPDVLDGVDALVLHGDVSLSDESSLAIRDWVRQGGRLILPIGETLPALTAGPLARWLPAVPKDQIEINKLSGLNELVPRSSTLRTLTSLPAVRLERSMGTVIATGLSEPLAIRSAYGAGMVTLLAIRLEAELFTNWESESQSRLASLLAGLPDPAEAAQNAQARSDAAAELNPAAVTDLQMQLNQSLDHFSGIRRSSHWNVMGWIALFGLIIGPLDYYLVTRVFKRPEWTWITLLGWTGLAAGLAASRADALNAHPSTARQIDLATLDLETRQLETCSWYGFYSDHSQRVALQAEPVPQTFGRSDWKDARLITEWIDRPGEGFRGMYRSGGIDTAQPGYQFRTDRTGIENLPIEIWSTGSLGSRWSAPLDTQLPVDAELVETGINRIAGTIRHHFPGELTDWLIAYDSFAYFNRAGGSQQSAPWATDQELNLSQASSILLRGRLLTMIEHLASAEKTRESGEAEMRREAYDPLNTDPTMIGLTASFYRLLGGENYTGLQNESLSRFDLSGHLQLHRAVLFGRLKLPATHFTVNGKSLPVEEQSVLVRVILPVKPSDRSSDAPPPTDILNYRR